jgi:hypothetical protein
MRLVGGLRRKVANNQWPPELQQAEESCDQDDGECDPHDGGLNKDGNDEGQHSKPEANHCAVGVEGLHGERVVSA